jgi:hypothetical protein
MANVFLSNVTWFVTLCVYLLSTHPPIYLTNYLFIAHSPTHLPITYLPTYLPTYICSHSYTYLFTYPPTYPSTCLPKFNH